MSTKHTLNSLGLVGVFAAAIFVVAFALLMFIGEYGIIASFFMAFLVALLAAIVLFLGLGSSSSQSAPVNRSSASDGDAAVAPSPAAGAAAAAAVDKEAEERAAAANAAREKQAAEEEAARRAAADAEAAEAKRQSELDAARAKAEAEAKAAADAEAARTAAEASAASAAVDTSIPDYDGDGVQEGVNEGTRPAGLDAPRDGKADDLKQIKGIGPKLEKLCNTLGFWHFDQVAAWTSDEVAWVDANLQGFKGRVTRDEWVAQAKVLAAGGETEFSKRVEDGDVY